MSTTTWRCNDGPRQIGARSPGSKTPGDPGTPPVSDTRQKTFQLPGKTATKELPDARLVKIVSRFPCEPPREKQKHRLYTLLHSAERHQNNPRNTARGASQPAKPASTCHCRCRRRAQPRQEEQETVDLRIRAPRSSRTEGRKLGC